MNKHRSRIVIATAILLFNSGLWGIVVKIGSIASTHSPWDNALNAIALEWGKITNGTVTLKVYPNGIAGSEQDMLRKLSLGTLDGGIFSTLAMTKLNPNLYVFSSPFLLNTQEELDYVFDKMQAARLSRF